MFRHWIAHWQIEPNPWVDSPIRPYAAAPSAAANSRVIRRISSAGTPDDLRGVLGREVGDGEPDATRCPRRTPADR